MSPFVAVTSTLVPPVKCSAASDFAVSAPPAALSTIAPANAFTATLVDPVNVIEPASALSDTDVVPVSWRGVLAPDFTIPFVTNTDADGAALSVSAPSDLTRAVAPPTMRSVVARTSIFPTESILNFASTECHSNWASGLLSSRVKSAVEKMYGVPVLNANRRTRSAAGCERKSVDASLYHSKPDAPYIAFDWSVIATQ